MKNLLVISLLIFTKSFSQNISDNLLIHYSFNGNAVDVSGNGYDGTIFGASFGVDRFNNPNSAVYFDGINDYIDLPNIVNIKPSLPVSFAFWIKYDDFTYENSTVFNTSFEEDVNSGVYMNSQSNTGRLQISFGDGSNFYAPNSRRTYSSNTTINPGTWHHIAIVVRSSSDMKIYIDCVESGGSNSGTGGGLAYSSTPGSLGRHDRSLTNPTDYFKGALDDFQYWNRALTTDEIDALCAKSSCFDNIDNDDITIQNTCQNGMTNFMINGDFDSILWNFDDFDSGTDNMSNLVNPIHIYNTPGLYHVSAVLNCGDERLTLNKEVLITSRPVLNAISDLHSCEDNYNTGISSSFDISTVESQLIGSQPGLQVFFQDESGNALPYPLFQNSIPDIQKIFVKVTNISNPDCYTETSFNLVVHQIPHIDLEKDYTFCDSDSPLTLTLNSNYDTYEWRFENNTIISNTYEALLGEEGIYTVLVTQEQNGIACGNSFTFNLKKSTPPRILDVIYNELDGSYIKIIATGESVIEYSIDGINYQNNNFFENIADNVSTVFVRDTNGCSLDFRKVMLLNYPKFFTPNNDGVNDFWQINGIDKFPTALIYLFDRYGKLLKQMTASDIGWNGMYNGRVLPSSDYWFALDLQNGNTFKGHFSLKR